MYPTLSYLIYDITGKYYPLPLFTFGIMMAISFAAAYYIFYTEFQRKEKEGIIPSMREQKAFGILPTTGDTLISTLIGGIIGYKLIGFFTNYSDVSENPQEYIMSLKGSFLGFLLGAGLSLVTTYYERKQIRKDYPVPETKEVDIYPHQRMGSILMVAAISGLIGAKLFDAMERWDDFISDPLGQLASFSGLTFYGGLICGAMGVLWYTRRFKIPLLPLLDIGAPAMMLAYGVGRIGCQLSGDGDWGIVNTAPKPGWMSFLPDWMWAFDYPRNVAGEGAKILMDAPGKYRNALEQPVFPTPFYEVIMGLALFFLLWSLRKRITKPGILWAIYLMVNGLERFFIEKIRVNSKYTIGNFSFTQAEMISSLLFIVGALMWAYLLIRKDKAPLVAENVPEHA
jgi:phosphatidylglycerol:prolipoprotein diacylglycerol transferase